MIIVPRQWQTADAGGIYLIICLRTKEQRVGSATCARLLRNNGKSCADSHGGNPGLRVVTRQRPTVETQIAELNMR